MATTKIWAIKDSLNRVLDYAANPEKTEYLPLRKSIHYIEDPAKTATNSHEVSYAVSGINCSPETAFEEMINVQDRFGKTGRNVAYHAYQSFKTGEVTDIQCHRLGVELAEKMWGNEYQVLVATHYNTGTFHNHFVINSVNMWTGKKFNCDKRAYFKFRALSDEICREHHLTVIHNPSAKTPRSIYFAEKNGEPTKYNLMRQAIDEAIQSSTCMKDFYKAMNRLGYYVDTNPAHAYATIRSIHSSKNTRLYRLGEGYDRDEIVARVRENFRNNPRKVRQNQEQFFRRFDVPEKQTFHLKGSFSTLKRHRSLLAFYYHYLYLLGAFNRPEGYRPLSPELREDLRRIDKYSRQVRLLCSRKINSNEELESFIAQTEKDMEAVKAARNKVYNQLRRCNDEDEILRLKQKRDLQTKTLKALRSDLKTAHSVFETQPKMKETMRAENQMKLAAIERSERQRSQPTRRYYRGCR